MSQRICPVCGVAMDEHQVCEGCEALVGPQHAAKSCFPHRGHLLCLYCLSRWQKIEMIAGREIRWEHFCYPPIDLVRDKEVEEEQSETESQPRLGCNAALTGVDSETLSSDNLQKQIVKEE